MPEREDFARRAVQEWGVTLPELSATADELSALIRLSRIAGIQDRLDDRTLERFEEDGIRGSEDFRTLALLLRSPPGLTNSELLEQLGGSKAGVSTRMERFRNHGITDTIASTTDRRSHTNTLTQRGGQLTARLVSEVVSARKSLLASLTPDQVSVLSTMLADMIEHNEPGG